MTINKWFRSIKSHSHWLVWLWLFDSRGIDVDPIQRRISIPAEHEIESNFFFFFFKYCAILKYITGCLVIRDQEHSLGKAWQMGMTRYRVKTTAKWACITVILGAKWVGQVAPFLPYGHESRLGNLSHQGHGRLGALHIVAVIRFAHAVHCLMES